MVSTKKNLKSLKSKSLKSVVGQSMNAMLSGHECSMACLNHWFAAMHEKLGWMLLAKAHGYSDKIASYLLSLERLDKSLEMKLRTTEDKDRKADLHILMKDLETLKHHARCDLTCDKNEVKPDTECNTNTPEHPCTLHGLIKWHKHKFEKLGWIVQAMAHGNLEKVACYINSVRCLHACLHWKLANLHDNDRKDDVKSMIKNVEILLAHIKRDFTTVKH